MLSPVIWVAVFGFERAIFPYSSPALFSVPAGFLAIWLESRGPSALYWRAFLMVGVLGALTTYSALMVECLLFARSDRQGLVPAYLAVTLMGGLVLVWLGSRLAGLLRGSAW